jgi:hypothetical protein
LKPWFGTAELAARRTSKRARNIHTLASIAHVSEIDMARVSAVKAMEQIADVADEKRAHPGAQQTPGLQIIQHAPAGPPRGPVEIIPGDGWPRPDRGIAPVDCSGARCAIAASGPHSTACTGRIHQRASLTRAEATRMAIDLPTRRPYNGFGDLPVFS